MNSHERPAQFWRDVLDTIDANFEGFEDQPEEIEASPTIFQWLPVTQRIKSDLGQFLQDGYIPEDVLVTPAIDVNIEQFLEGLRDAMRDAMTKSSIGSSLLLISLGGSTRAEARTIAWQGFVFCRQDNFLRKEYEQVMKKAIEGANAKLLFDGALPHALLPAYPRNNF